MAVEIGADHLGSWVTLDLESGWLKVTGALELAFAPTVQAELTLLLQEAVRPQVVDLSEVTALSVAGIRALENVRDMAAYHQIDVTFVTAPRGVADLVLNNLATDLEVRRLP
jgi:anti-anti-sigma regulatory factor